MTRLAVSTSEAADLLGVSARTVQRLVAAGAIPHMRIASKVRIPVAALELWCLDAASIPSSGGVGGAAGRSMPAHRHAGATTGGPSSAPQRRHT